MSQISELLTEYLQECLISLTEIASKVKSTDFIQNQNAQDIAILFGVMSDKAYKLVEAGQRAQLLKNHPEILFHTPAFSRG